jgi:DNA invertase Pin-like site-specific DNA recombinase
MAQIAFSYIRFSSNEQAAGDSLRRQTALAVDYAKANGLKLDQSLTFRDLGVSGFSGKNRVEGALGAFVKACQSKRVPPGSALLVESLDRLSREQIRKPLRLLLELIDDHKITVHTLADGRVYGQGTETEQLIYSLFVMARANEESERKSQRIGAAWKNKKLNAGKLPGIAITRTAPSWIDIDAQNQMTLNPARAKIVREIYQMALDGLGSNLIGQRLNERGVPTFTGRSKGWKGQVDAIFYNPAVFGTYVPRKVNRDGSREPDGLPVEGYYPAAIDRALFERVKAARGQRCQHPRGQSDSQCKNLLAGIVRDADKDLSMVYYNTQRQIITNCYSLRQTPSRIKYDRVEKAFLHFLDELDWQSLCDGPVNENLVRLETELAKCQADQSKAQRNLEKFLALIESDDAPAKSIVNKIKDLEAEQSVLEKLAQSLQAQTRAERAATIDKPEDLRAALRQGSDLNLRFKLREQIRQRVEKVELFFSLEPLVFLKARFVNGSERTLILWPEDSTKILAPAVQKIVDQLKSGKISTLNVSGQVLRFS